jgi:hypothetical protein
MQTPEISVNKLAEFVNASTARKGSILKTIKSKDVEAASKRNRYATAKSSITGFLTDEHHKMEIFEAKRTQLINKKAETTQQKNDVKNSLAAIKILEQLAHSGLKPYLKFTSKRSSHLHKNTRINGVLIHLSPDIIFYTKDEVKGAMKLIFSKDRPITPLEGQVIAGLTARFLGKLYKTKIQSKNCFALDVFAKRVFPVPDSFSLHSRMLRKTYSEINKLWPSIK